MRMSEATAWLKLQKTVFVSMGLSGPWANFVPWYACSISDLYSPIGWPTD
jgi:hypothetical protein